MRTLWIQLDAQSAVVATASSATLGATPSLPYLPGAMLRGAVAASVYTALGDAALAVFHRGAVRFGDALPCNGAHAQPVPAPLSFHHPKLASGLDAWRNHAAVDAMSDEYLESQPKQLRGGYLTGVAASGSADPRHFPATESSERTAVADDTVRDGFLYSVHALQGGQRFLAPIQVADDLPDQVVEAVMNALTGTIRLGRSRCAEFGRVHASRVSDPGAPRLANSGDVQVSRVPILLVSDVWLRDPVSGAPTLTLQPAHLGLPDGAFRVVTERCFLRTRTYSPFNGKRRRPDHERTVIVQGSVITLDIEPRDGTEVSLATLREAAAAGIGDGLGDGLGRVLVAPAFLCGATVDASALRWGAASVAHDAKLPDQVLKADPLLAIARRRVAADRHRLAALDLAKRWKRQLEGFQVNRAQWGRLRNVTAAAATFEGLLQSLEKMLQPGEDKGRVAQLRAGWGQSRNAVRYGDQVLKLIKDSKAEHDVEVSLRAARLLPLLMVRSESTGTRT